MLELRSIHKTFNPGTVNEKHALRGIDLHLNKGDFVTVIGSNGAGKSTLFNAVAGTFLPDSGTVILDGQDITRLPDHKRSKFTITHTIRRSNTWAARRIIFKCPVVTGSKLPG